jgi:hypothetical protein
MTEQLQSLDTNSLNNLFAALGREHRNQIRRGKSPVQMEILRHQMDFVYSILSQRRFNHLSETKIPVQDVA